MSLTTPGFHVIFVERYKKLTEKQPIEGKRLSVIEFLRKIKRAEIYRRFIVDGLDELLESSTNESLEQIRKLLNDSLDNLIAKNTTVVFVVNHKIEGMPYNLSLCDRPLALVFPRPPDLSAMRPGYAYYPFM